MARSYFIWNGVNSLDMGIICRRAAPIIRPEERIDHMTIPGLSGDLTLLQGEDIYNAYIQTVELSVRGAANVNPVFKWLRGAGEVIFSSDPDRKQAARVIGAVTLDRVSRNLDHWAGSVQFYCQPFKERLSPASYSVAASSQPPSASLTIAGDVDTLPLIELTPCLTGFVTLSINGTALMIQSCTQDVPVLIDCHACEVTSVDGSERYVTQGSFPRMTPGENRLTGTGWTDLIIDPRERWL